MLRIAKGHQNLCKLQPRRQHVGKSISNEIVRQPSSQESNGWKNPEDPASFCQIEKKMFGCNVTGLSPLARGEIEKQAWGKAGGKRSLVGKRDVLLSLQDIASSAEF